VKAFAVAVTAFSVLTFRDVQKSVVTRVIPVHMWGCRERQPHTHASHNTTHPGHSFVIMRLPGQESR
jgi:hypothetical protein